MRVKRAALCVAVFAGSVPAAAEAQSARQILDRHIMAIGGRSAIEKIASAEVSGTVTAPDGLSGGFIQRTAGPHRLHVSLSWGGAWWRTGFNGRSAWQDDSVEGWQTLYGPPASRVRAEASYASRHFLASADDFEMSVAGRDQVRDRAVFVLVAVTPDGTARKLFFDIDSYLLVKDEQQTDAGTEERFFDDYRRVDQVMEPHRIEWQRNGETFRIAVDRVLHNASFDESLVDVPVTSAEAVPSVEAVLAAAARQEQQADQRLTSYVYSMTTASGRVDEQGRVTLGEGASYETFHLGGRPVTKLVKKRGGEALSEAERRQEDERVNAIIKEYERERLSGRPARRAPQQSSGGAGILRTPLLSANWFPAFQRMCAFSRIRRERVGGRPAFVVEFQPRPDARPQTDFERQASRTAGALWIDEATQHVMRMESYLRDDYERTTRGSSLRIERTILDDEVWLPSRAELRFRQDFAFGSRSQWVNTLQYWDYRKFGVETDSNIALPAPER
jgi:hypothetical protein